MKNLDLTKQNDRNSGDFSLADFSSESQKQRLNVVPFQIAADRSLENELQCFAMFLFHVVANNNRIEGICQVKIIFIG